VSRLRPLLRISLIDSSQIQIHRVLLDLVIVTEKDNTEGQVSSSDLHFSFVRGMLSFDLNLVLSKPAVSNYNRPAVMRGGKRYLVERDVVLDVVRFFLGFGVVPGDVCDGLAIDGGVVVRGGPEREIS